MVPRILFCLHLLQALEITTTLCLYPSVRTFEALLAGSGRAAKSPVHALLMELFQTELHFGSFGSGEISGTWVIGSAKRAGKGIGSFGSRRRRDSNWGGMIWWVLKTL